MPQFKIGDRVERIGVSRRRIAWKSSSDFDAA
jgi:hypothetical protein